ncbi:MAG: Holliday junction branch migration protein RuvA [Spirochaetales bacterium]|uniref:Holliday junction branch migration complex subunit RuvA n=1 Tax=Candidatus Thalassospirochaeta sargassi TaxID=3119039 RepID=A0AAJ1IDS2_9SPIO|nr:Holliday junction branch migration protein RuvA [Spirochaetales bacterium]
MFNSIYGTITHKDDSKIFLELNGIEWQIFMPFNSITKLPPAGENARIYTHLQHSQDNMQLFGFSNQRERTLFLDLLKVGGIGPKQSIKILSGIEIDNFIKQLDDNDVDALTRLPGLGKKTAQKIILTLRGKLSFDEAADTSAPDSDIVKALVDMGFDRKSSEAAVKRAAEEEATAAASESEREQTIFRRAIILLSS